MAEMTRQQKHRAGEKRKLEQWEPMAAALRLIVAKLEGRAGPVSQEVCKIARDALPENQ